MGVALPDQDLMKTNEMGIRGQSLCYTRRYEYPQ